MFPILHASHSKLTPEIYFGGADVPQYWRRKCSPDLTPGEAVEEIRLISVGQECAGYICPDGIHIHLFEEDEQMHVDMSREFVFIASSELETSHMPSAWHILRFLQEPARRALWIVKGLAVYAEKTERTMALCKELDAIWQEDSLLPLLQEAVMTAEVRDQLLPALMRRYEERTKGTSSMMWQFFDTFGAMLEEQHLFLLRKVIVEPRPSQRRT